MPRQPDYRLHVKYKSTEETARVGAAWVNPGGSISIRLDPCVVLQRDPDLLITLFPIDKGSEAPADADEAKE